MYKMRSKAFQEIVVTFAFITGLSILWVSIIMADGLKNPSETISIMFSHLQDFGAYFLIFDIIVVGLLYRWFRMTRKPPKSVWE
jgi:hypothetical protein